MAKRGLILIEADDNWGHHMRPQSLYVMNDFTKLDQLRVHLLRPNKAVETHAREKRVQKNLSILESDARRLIELAKAEGISQAKLLSLALDAFETTKK